MQQLVPQLTDNLDRTIALYEQILATERGKQRAVVACDLDTLGAVLAREEELVELARPLEAERAMLRAQFAQADERLGPDSRLKHLLALLDGPERDLLAEKRRRLLTLAGQIQEVNRVNFQLLRCSLDLVRGILEEIFGSAPAPGTYDAAGRQDAPSQAPTRVDQVL